MSGKKERNALPGDTLAVVEEFGPGAGTYSTGEFVKALTLGVAEFNMKQREVVVKSPVKRQILPTKGDSIDGIVEATQANAINVRIIRINGQPSNANFTGMLLIRQEGRQRRQRRVTIAKSGDLIRASVISTKNAILHLALKEDKDGVLTTVCSICGGEVVRIDDRVKCKECGYVEERALSADFTNG